MTKASKGKPTPGPWEWSSDDERGEWFWAHLKGPNGEGIIVGQDRDGGPCEKIKAMMDVEPHELMETEAVHVRAANARLIAAAPELLEACEDFEATYGADRTYQEMRYVMERIHFAIKKARGE